MLRQFVLKPCISAHTCAMQAARPSEEEGTPYEAPAPHAPPPARRGFADAFETFVARGICDSPSASAQHAQAAPGTAETEEVASAAAAVETAIEGDLLSPEPRSGGHRPPGEPASAGGSVLGSTGGPEGETSALIYLFSLSLFIFCVGTNRPSSKQQQHQKLVEQCCV